MPQSSTPNPQLPGVKDAPPSVPSDIAAALEAGETIGAEIGKVIRISDRHAPYLLVRDCKSWKCIETDAALLERPRTLNRHVVFTDVTSFCDYLKEFPGGTTRCYATLPQITPDAVPDGMSQKLNTAEQFGICALLDDHAEGKPSWCDHKARLQLARSQAWAEWLSIHRVPLTQRQFAEFIEDHIGQIVNPDGARMLDIASAINVSTSAAFKSAVNLGNGQIQLQYVETVKDENQDGVCKIPQKLELELPVFDFTAPVTITARLRYRIAEGKIALALILDNAAQVERTVFIEDVCHTVQDTTKRPLYFGEVIVTA